VPVGVAGVLLMAEGSIPVSGILGVEGTKGSCRDRSLSWVANWMGVWI